MKTHTSRITSIIGTYHLATETEISHGLRWYEQAHTAALDMSREYPVGVITAAGVIAALSPNNRWGRNLLDARNMLALWVNDEDPTLAKPCTYSANTQKAVTIMKLTNPSVDDICNVLNGRKVSAFARCILGDQQSVCVDGHAYSIWAGERITTTTTPSIGKALYEQITSDYRTAAAMIKANQPHGPWASPAQLQAITWITHRRIHT